MEVKIEIDEKVLQALVKKVAEHMAHERNIEPHPWVDTPTAMQMLGIKSKTSLQQLRDEGCIRFTTPLPKKFLYHRQSILDYLEQQAKEPF